VILEPEVGSGEHVDFGLEPGRDEELFHPFRKVVGGRQAIADEEDGD
jgi:hypothetical protein